MSIGLGSAGELTDLAQAIGILDGNGDLDTSWFANPLGRLEAILSDAGQRAALLRFCDAVLPPVAEPGRPSTEKWHPLLGPADQQPKGNLYLTLTEVAGGVLLGLGGELHSGPGAAVGGRLRVQADLLSAGSSVELVIGTAAHPIVAEARVETGWSYDPGAGHPVGLAAITARGTLVPDPDRPSFGLQIVLEQLSLAGEPAVDKIMDVDQLGAEAPELLAALLKIVLSEAGADPTVTLLADHLLALFGLADAGGIPAFPFEQLSQTGQVALQQWLAELAGVSGTGGPTVPSWLEQLAGLLGQSVPAGGTGVAGDPWRVQLITFGPGRLEVTLERTSIAQTPALRFGLAASIGGSLGTGEPTLGVDAVVAIADLPLAGTGHARVLPAAAILLRVSGEGGDRLVDRTEVTIGSLQAGIRWDGAALVPVLQLLDDAFAGTPYPVLDLTDVSSVEAAATAVVVNAVNDALGGGVGRRIAAIAGLVPPEDPAHPGSPVAGWTHQLDLPSLVVDPARAIESYQRAVLRDGTNWSLILHEIAALIGLADAVGGSGTPADPWTVLIAAEGTPALQLAAWHQPDPAAATTEQLRLGLRLAASPFGSSLALTSEVLTFELPDTGPAQVGFLGAQQLSLLLDPAVDAAAGPVGLRLDSLGLVAGWSPGTPFGWQVHAHGLRVSADGEELALDDLHLPPVAPFDLTDLPGTATALGLSVTQLENLTRLLIGLLPSAGSALSGADPQARLALALLGLQAGLPGLDADVPSLVDPAHPGLLLTDPLGALRGWLSRLLTHVGADGQASLAVLLRYLAALGTDEFDQLLGGATAELVPDLPALLDGAGTFADPWRVPWPGGGTGNDSVGAAGAGPELELWLEPAGPPSAWLAGLQTRAQDALDLDGLAEVLLEAGWYDPALRSLTRGLTARDLTTRLRALQVQLNGGDGVVPADAQTPDVFGWLHGPVVDAVHPGLPRHPDVVAAVLSQIETLRGSGPRTVLLVGPAFGDHTVWADLLGSPQRQGPTDPGANFDLRTPGIDPRTISLDDVTAVADYYTADLADDRSGDPAFLAAQLDHVADRLAVLHPGPLILIAHSYAGLAGRRYAADHPDRVQGLITLGTPHLGSPLTFLTDPELGDGIRLAALLRGGLPDSPVRDAVDHLSAALEGYRAPATAGTLDQSDPYPASSFTMAAPFDVGDVTLMTIGASLVDDVFAALQTAVAAYLQQLVATGRPDPTHLGYGMAMPPALGPAATDAPVGAPVAEARVRFGLGQLPFASGSGGPAAPRPAHLLRVELDLLRADDWLVGGPGVTGVDGRLRRLQLGLTCSAGGSGVQGVLDATLDQAAWHGRTVAVADLTDPRAAALIGAGFDAALAGTTDTGTTNGTTNGTTDAGPAGTGSGSGSATGLAAALLGLELVGADAQGAGGLSADGLAALRTDPIGYLRGRIPAALARTGGWAGLAADPSVADPGPEDYAWTPSGGLFSLFARQQSDGSWRTGIEVTTGSTGDGSGSTGLIGLGVDIDLLLPAFQPTVELTVDLGPAALRYRTADGTISLAVPPWLDELELWPTPSLSTLAARLDADLPQILVSGVLGTVLAEFAPGLRLGPLQQLLTGPGEFLAGADVLGLTGGGFDAAKLGTLIGVLNTAIGLPAGPGLQLPGDVSVTAGIGAAPGSARIGIATGAPIGGVLAVELSLDVDAQHHVIPGGTVTVTTPLAGSWPQLAIAFGVGPGGVTLVLTPDGVPPLTLLPTFSGLGALAGAAGGLLLSVLDAGVHSYADPKPAWLSHLLAAAGHLDLYDPAGGFAAHASSFTAMLEGTWFDDVDPVKQSALAGAVVDLLTLIPALPGTLTSVAGLVRWSLALPSDDGTLALAAGWGSNGATVQLDLSALQPGDAPLQLSARAQIDGLGLDVSTSLGLDLSSIGVSLVPRLVAGLDAGAAAGSPGAGSSTRFSVSFTPLSDPALTGSAADGPLVVQLAPSFSVTADPSTGEALLTGWALPLAVQVALQAAQPMLTVPLWTGGPTLSQSLTDAGILTDGHLVHPLPNLFTMLAGFLAEAASLLDLPLGDLRLRLVDEAGRVGLEVSGHQDIPLGDLDLSVLFGAPTAWGPAAAAGLEVFLLDVSGASPQFDFGLALHGIGVGLGKSDGTALVAESYLRLGSVKALLFGDLETSGGLHLEHPGGGLELGGFGLPIGAALGAGGGSNPVASNLLSSGGGTSASGGDGQSVNPTSDLDVWYWDDPANTGGPLRVLIGGQTGVFWIPIHAGFGPIFIDELGLGVSNTAVSLDIDGGISVAGLSADVDDLSVTIPYAHLTDPSQWQLDLKGLAIGYSGPAVSIAGGLVKFDGPPIEYDGMLMIKIGSIGAIVIGSYSVVGDGADQYTSFAIFGGVFVPIGLPPLIEISGIALGLGYNRRLIVPEDLNQVPNFMLVQALDRPEALANNPMQALYAFREQVPPARGALWFAAGLRGTSFELVNVTAVLYVALDKGVEVGLLGVARMALPTDDAAIVSIELALKARFSSAEGLFSIQAQLTDNSWLISKDCQLTGGFAFFWWFSKSQFLLTLGGYHPSFKPLPEYPVVPRLGYRWDFLGVVHIKGESYFALTSTAVMTGVRMEASYGPDWIQVWFTAYTDILVTRDPFHYELDIGISIGARLRIEVCFFACCTIEISVSVGASLHLAGPPFHGSVTADLGVTSITVPFGDDAQPLPPAKHWDEFVSTYVRAGDQNALGLNAQVESGLLPAEPAGAPVAPGTATQPWRLAAEWTLRTQTTMPVRGFALQVDTTVPESQIGSAVFGRFDDLAETYDFDLAPMYVHASSLTTVHRVVIAIKPENGTDYVDLVPRAQNPTDPTLALDETLFRVTPLIGQLSEATYHYFPDLKPPAAANTLPALVGIKLDGVAGLHDQSQVIPIGTLVDATNYRPLPFARRSGPVVAQVLAVGAAWQTLAATATGVDTPSLLRGVSAMVGGSGEFATLRADSGLRPAGYGPVARSALLDRRSAPPVLSALSEGFTLADVGAGLAPPTVKVGEVAGVLLDAPRLRSTMQRAVLPLAGSSTVRTTVPVYPPNIDRRTPPVVEVRQELITAWDAPGFALLTRPPTGSGQPTRAARSTRTLRHPALGGAVGRAAAAALDTLTTQALGDGAALRSGASQLWELPARSSWQLQLTGDSSVRITQLTSAGTVLTDAEYPPAAPAADGTRQPRLLALTPGAGMVAVTALGLLDPVIAAQLQKSEDAGETDLRGAVAVASSSAGSLPVLGWQLGSEVVQVGPTTVLARGAVLSLTAPTGAEVRQHRAATGMITVSRALLDQQVTQTDFPVGSTVIAVLVDSPSAQPLGPESVIVHTDPVAVVGSPVQLSAGNRTMFIYDLHAPLDPPPLGDRFGDQSGDQELTTARLAVSVGLVNPAGIGSGGVGWGGIGSGGIGSGAAPLGLAGVLATTGTAAAWAASLDGSTLTQVVGDEHLSADGGLQTRLLPMEVDDHG